MSFFRFLRELLSGASARSNEPSYCATHSRTLCCDVPMFDVWMHTENCPNFNMTLDKIKAWRTANPGVPLMKMPRSVDVPPAGDHSGMCPHCGFPTGFFGVYIVGEKCSWCGYLEKRYV